MPQGDLPDDVMANLLGTTGADETILTRWSHCALSNSPAVTLGRGLAGDLPVPEVNTRTVRRMGDAQSADYLVVDQLGEGGMGIVFEAEQVYFARRVALKMIKPALASDPMAVKAFFREAVITSRLEHPGIIPVLDFGISQDGRALYAMMKAGGVPWHRVMRDKTLSENLAIYDRVADIVDYAHSHGILHRDIKPANVMLGEHGEVWLGDWGVALARQTDGSYSHAGPAGTPQYMAPEMARCDAGSIGPASDIYLLGAVLFEIITGKPPHDGDNSHAALLNSARNVIHAASQSNGLLQIAYKAMAERPEQRFASVGDLRDAVTRRLRLNDSVYRQQQADTHLSAARKTGDYELFQQAIAGYDEAISLSPENATAKRNRGQALVEYADKALAKGEFDLAASIIQSEESEADKRIARMVEKIAKGRAATKRRHRRRTWANTVLGSIVFLTLMGGAYIYFDRIGNPKSRFHVPDPVFERKHTMGILRSNSARIQTLYTMMQSRVYDVLSSNHSSNSAEIRYIARQMDDIFEYWKKLHDVPDTHGDINAIRIMGLIREDWPKLEGLVKEYRDHVGETPSGATIDLLEEDLAKMKEYLDDSARRQEEMEKADTQ